MGNAPSSPTSSSAGGHSSGGNNNKSLHVSTRLTDEEKRKYRSFPGSAILEKTFCGSIDTTDPAEYQDVNIATRLLKKADIMCVSSPSETVIDENNNAETTKTASRNNNFDSNNDINNNNNTMNPSSALLARALVSEVTDNPKTMKSSEMAAREHKLMRAALAASKRQGNNHASNPLSGIAPTATGNHTGITGGTTTTTAPAAATSKPVGSAGGVGPPSVLGSLTYACTGDEQQAVDIATHNLQCAADTTTTSNTAGNHASAQDNRPSSMMMMKMMMMNGTGVEGGVGSGGGVGGTDGSAEYALGPYAVTIGMSLSRRYANVGHPDTITRQTAFDFNELQDRNYKYVSSTDATGWKAGGGEKGGPSTSTSANTHNFDEDNSEMSHLHLSSPSATPTPMEKLASPDNVHIPIIHINCPSQEEMDQVVHALASGEIFIPHMAITPEALSVNGNASPPDLVLRFGCERNDDIAPDDWPNWCLEFMHNQLYEYFYSSGALWMKRPFAMTLARKVRWKTVKHMNRYFAHAEKVIEGWREKGPQYCDPQLSYIEGGATPEEVAKPHGIYLLRNGIPTNYFAPNFDPPYTTKMTRSLLYNVLNKSWDKKRREWTSEPIPKLVTPQMLMAAALGCTDPTSGGYLASEVTEKNHYYNAGAAAPVHVPQQQQQPPPPLQQQQQQQQVLLQQKRSDRMHAASPPLQQQQQQLRSAFDAPVEEKKTEEPNAAGARVQQQQQQQFDDFNNPVPTLFPKPKRSTSRPNVEEERTWSLANQSVAASGTTVMHANKNSGRRLFIDDDDDWGLKASSGGGHSGSTDPPGEKVTAVSSPLWTRRKNAKELLEEERERNAGMLSKAREYTGTYSMTPNTKKLSPRVERNNSGTSLEYSTDGSSWFFNQDASLAGQQYANDSASVRRGGRGEEDDGSTTILSLQESTSSATSIIPTDEELFSVGWAKALDPKSGNYYYFTLDRTVTVWENPLSQNASVLGDAPGA